MDESHQELEHYLIEISSNDNEKIQEATRYIVAVLQEPDVLDRLFFIITNSIEPLAIAQAAIQCVTYTKMNWKRLTKEVRINIANFFLSRLVIPSPQQAMKQLIGAIDFFLSSFSSPWPELVEFIQTDEINDQNSDLFAAKMHIFMKALPLFEDDILLEKVEIYSHFCNLGLHSSNLLTIFDAMQIISRLIGLNPEPFVDSLLFFPELIQNIIQSEKNSSEKQRFFELISFIISSNQSVEPIVEKLIELGKSTEISSHISLLCLNSLESVVNLFSSDEIDELLEISLIQMARFIEENGELPTDFLDFEGSVVNTFPHNDVYNLFKQKILDSIEQESISLAISSILFILPVFDFAPEVFHGEEIEFVSSLLHTGFQCDSPLAIQSICYVIGSIAAIDQMTIILPQFVPFFVELCKTQKEDSDLLFECYDALDLLLSKKISHSPETFQMIWELQEEVDENNQSKYMHLLKNCISQSNQHISTETLNTVLEFVIPFMQEPIQDLELATNCLSIISAFITKEEEQTDKLELCVPILNLAFEQSSPQKKLPKENDDFPEDMGEETAICNCLEFIKELADSMGEAANDFLVPFLPNVMKIVKLRRKNVPHIRWKTAMEAICAVIRHVHNFDNLKIATKVLTKRLRTSDDENEMNELILFIRLVVKYHTEKKKLELFKIILEIAQNAESDDLLGTCFLCLKKITKNISGSEQAQQFVLEQGFSLCNDFISGNLTALDGRQMTPEGDEESGEIFSNLCEDFAEFASELVGMSQDIVDELISLFISVANSKSSETYNSILLSVFIGSFEKNTFTETCLNSFFELLPQLVAQASPNCTQQDIVYLLNLLINKIPELSLPHIQQIGLIPKIIEWWQFSFENRSLFGDLASNIASLIINMTNHSLVFDISVLKQCFLMFPPEDETETFDMTQYFLVFLQNHELDQETQLIVSAGLAKLVTQNQTKLIHQKLNEEILGTLIHLLKQLVANEANLKSAQEALNGSEAKLAKLLSFLQ